MIRKASRPGRLARKNRPLLWLAEHAEGPNEIERFELERLAQETGKLPFWRFLVHVIPPYVQYESQCHRLTLGGAR
jgi:hypothetical protein